VRGLKGETMIGREQPAVLITGGAGFIGANLSERLLGLGHRVVILDNLSRAGVDQNASWLLQHHRRNLRIIVGDVRDTQDVRRAMEGVHHVFHLAAQVAVTTSLSDPRTDFEVNALGTLNVLEEMRRAGARSIIYTSTNKVYGGLEDVALKRSGERYVPVDPRIAETGISESRPLDFHSPYGCSKGAADQYVIDYGRTMGLSTLVFRMSCIYGPRQFGTEDQGWVAHFLIRALDRRPITLYGDGLQVRDVLYAEDLMDAFLGAWDNIDRLAGRAFNIGGGVANSVSLLEVIDLIGERYGKRPEIRLEPSRPGDQRYYVSDYSAFREATGWSPRTTPRAGVGELAEWLVDSRRFAAEEIAAS
jgi:CDP-paratose 2-epimerase